MAANFEEFGEIRVHPYLGGWRASCDHPDGVHQIFVTGETPHEAVESLWGIMCTERPAGEPLWAVQRETSGSLWFAVAPNEEIARLRARGDDVVRIRVEK